MTSGPRRTTEVVTLGSDGRQVTLVTRDQSEFVAPVLAGPDGVAVDDVAAVRRSVALVAAAGGNGVLLSRPRAPDAGVSAARPPFDAPGRYVLYAASAPLSASVLVQCGAQQQRWSLTAEANGSAGQVSCAAQPAASNALARQVYSSNC